MWQFVILLTVLPLAAGLLLNAWFGTRVLRGAGRQTVTAHPERWALTTGNSTSTDTASEAGKALRQAALAQWRESDPQQVKAWESARRFGMAVPPLAVVIALLGIIATRIPFMAGIAVVLVFMALAVVFNLLHLGAEMRAISAAAGKLCQHRAFRRQDEEDAVVSCATAHAWREAIPPILRWL